MGTFRDLTGMKFERLTAIEIAGRDKYKKIMYKCVCECGGEKIVLGRSLLNGMCKSCGCLNLDRKRELGRHRGLSSEERRLYTIWKNMRDRCFNSKSRSFKDYGGRGITVCDEWADPDTGLDAFIKWAKTHGYSPELSIDRIDFNGNYMPTNCRWADWFVQANNRRKPAFVKNQYGIWGYRNAV